MTKEQLLNPRYKVVTEYPESPYTINQIIYASEHPDRVGEMEFFEKYPKIFHKLMWWEERKIEDMLPYIGYFGNGKWNWICKVIKHFSEDAYCIVECADKYGITRKYNQGYWACTPTTEEEFNSFNLLSIGKK